MSEGRWSRAALVLVGHGSSINPHSSAPTLARADEIRNRSLFAEVHAAFWKEAPRLSEILDSIDAPEIFVAPNLACKGYITGEVIPREMGLTGPVTERDGKRIVLCDPVGEHPRVAEAMAERARTIIETEGVAPDDACVLLIGHGTARNKQSSIRTWALADALNALNVAAEAQAAFLENAPLVKNWPEQTRAGAVIAIPFMISNGLHGAEDVPALLGIDPKDPKLAVMARDGTPAGPYDLHGRKLWYCRAIGSEPFVADLILDQVASAP